jgi:hypothetical protein
LLVARESSVLCHGTYVHNRGEIFQTDVPLVDEKTADVEHPDVAIDAANISYLLTYNQAPCPK